MRTSVQLTADAPCPDSGRSNYYNSAYSRRGFADVAAESQRLWLAGDTADERLDTLGRALDLVP